MSVHSASSDSEPEQDMHICISSIPSIRQLFLKSVLKAATNARYPPNPSLLDRIGLLQGDITRLEVDCIVNAANKRLLGGGGVDGAIHAAAGPGLLEECRGLGGAETGESKITRGYNLPSKHIIHTVGPIYSSSNADLKALQLASCYKTCLDLTVQNNLKHIAFCSISTGVYGYPIKDATHIALDVVRKFCDSDQGKALERIIFVVWSNQDRVVYESLIPEYFPPSFSETPPEATEDEPALI